MKKIITCLALLALLSCKNDTVKPINDMEVTETEPSNTTETTIVEKKEDLESLIANLQTEIEKSTPSNRKELLHTYLQYGPKMDGAVAETYGHFAFEYEQGHPQDFYSVLGDTDTAFIKQWAGEAASEIAIQVETEADIEAFFQDLKHTNEEKAAGLTAAQKALFDLYHKQLEAESYILLRN